VYPIVMAPNYLKQSSRQCARPGVNWKLKLRLKKD
jgi:hypothetical protein